MNTPSTSADGPERLRNMKLWVHKASDRFGNSQVVVSAKDWPGLKVGYSHDGLLMFLLICCYFGAEHAL